jgi:hypothetical protein
MIAADSQQRSREQGELGDCGGPLKKEKRMVISALSLFVVLTFARGIASDAPQDQLAAGRVDQAILSLQPKSQQAEGRKEASTWGLYFRMFAMVCACW